MKTIRQYAELQPDLWINTLLDIPDLPARVQTMAPEQLLTMVNKISLEESAELLALATPEQLAQMLDDDLWRSPGPGQDEVFDPKRFGLWMNVLNDMGPERAAGHVAEMDPAFLAMAFSKQIQVFKTALLEQIIRSNSHQGRQIEKLTESRLHHEFSEHFIISKDDQSWDAIIAIISELDQRYQDLSGKLLDHMAALSADLLNDDDQWEELLTLDEQLENDLIEDRETRREAQGFITPGQAAQWLAELRQLKPQDLLDAPVPEETRTYFEKFTEGQYAKAQAGTQTTASWAKQLTAANEPGLIKKQSENDYWLIHQALNALAKNDRRLHSRRMEELLYLSNMLMAGCAYQNRAFHRIESAQAVFSLSNLGLDYWLAQKDRAGEHKEEWLREKSIVTLFRAGMSLVHQLALAGAKIVIRNIGKLPETGQGMKDEKWIKKELLEIKESLEKGVKTNRPWQATDRLILLERVIEAHQVAVIRAIISEYPLWLINIKTNQPTQPRPVHSMVMLKDIKDWLDGLVF